MYHLYYVTYVHCILIIHLLLLNTVYKLDGVDFFYASRADARKFVEFLQSVVPCR